MINKAVGLLNFKQRVMQSSRNRTDKNSCFISDFSSFKINTDLLRLLSLGCFNKVTEPPSWVDPLLSLYSKDLFHSFVQ